MRSKGRSVSLSLFNIVNVTYHSCFWNDSENQRCCNVTDATLGGSLNMYLERIFSAEVANC